MIVFIRMAWQIRIASMYKQRDNVVRIILQEAVYRETHGRTGTSRESGNFLQENNLSSS